MTNSNGHQEIDLEVTITRKVLGWILGELMHIDNMIQKGEAKQASNKLQKVTFNLNDFLSTYGLDEKKEHN